MRKQGRLINAFAIASILSFSLAPGWSQTGGTPSSSGSASKRNPSAPSTESSKSKAGDAPNYGKTGSGGSSVPQSTADCPDGADPTSGLRQSPSPGSSAANKGAASSPSTAGSSARSNTASDRSLSNVNCLPSGGTSGSETGRKQKQR